MPKKSSTHGASAACKSKTARSKTAKAKSKGKAAPHKEARKAASEATSKRTAAAARQGGSPRRSRSRSLSHDDRSNPRFTYRDHRPGAESPVFDIPVITGSKSDGDSPGSTKDPTPSQDAPSQDAPVDDTESSEAKAASTSSPAKSLTLAEGKARDQAAKDESLFGNDIEAARCVLLAPHRIPLKEFTSLRKKPEDRGGLFPVWGYPWVQPENTPQAEDLFW
ncbi:ABC Superfamily [Phytophthora palmivora]|uniref:ABC Superfamily n=1 Tax=Phytophthora palmivora TaxID=4796 RepID=A0A2P4XJP6_9STRA|nr:ABC Superfamily [Phytophthora palmivora]